jgi:hypothetical protein
MDRTEDMYLVAVFILYVIHPLIRLGLPVCFANNVYKSIRSVSPVIFFRPRLSLSTRRRLSGHRRSAVGDLLSALNAGGLAPAGGIG